MDTSNQHDDGESADTGSSRPADPDVELRESGKTTPERSSKNQRQHQPPAEEDERFADDVLLGAQRIAEHVASILGVLVDANDVYYAHRMRKLPIGKYGALLIASKHQIARHIEQIASGPAAT